MSFDFIFDLHIHSFYSNDSMQSPKLITRIAKSRGLNAIAITDHETIKGGMVAKAFGDNELMAIIGSEIKTEYGDLIGLFLNENIKSRVFGEVIDEIKAQGGLVVFPHPYRRKKFPPIDLLNDVDIIEGINGRNTREIDLRGQILAKSLKKPVIAGSDSHFPYEIGSVRNCLKANEYDEEAFMRCVLNEPICMISRNLSPIIQKTSIICSALIKKVRSISINGLCDL